MITLADCPEPPADLTEAEWHLYLTADAKTQPHILTGCAAWLGAQKGGVSL